MMRWRKKLAVSSGQFAVSRWQLAVCRWQFADGSLQMAVCRWQFAKFLLVIISVISGKKYLSKKLSVKQNDV
jgi:hypothetical protein